MYLQSLELIGFKSFAKKSKLSFTSPISAIVGPNGSGKSNIAEAFRFALGEQSFKSMRGKRGEDLIWGGSETLPRKSHASVRVHFDNKEKLFDIDFDEVILERTVHRDGVNQYLINGSQVRLRDVVELMATANIGASGHHIISQGESDHILSVRPRERKEIVEDALGLRVYRYKIAESERKLGKTKENIKQVQLLRNEIGPHLRFLKRQVEKVEKTFLLREELVTRYTDYFKREELYLARGTALLDKEREKPRQELEKLEKKLKEAKESLVRSDSAERKESEIIGFEKELRVAREKKDELTQIFGRLEGQIDFEKKNLAHSHPDAEGSDSLILYREELEKLAEDIKNCIERGEETSDSPTLKGLLQEMYSIVQTFISGKKELGAKERHMGKEHENTLDELRKEYEFAKAELEAAREYEITLGGKYAKLKKHIESAKDKGREAERLVFYIMTEQNELRTTLNKLEERERELSRDRRAFEEELEEGAAIVGADIHRYKERTIRDSGNKEGKREDVAMEDRSVQEKRRKDIERIKIRLEEVGGGSGEEVMKEYKDIKERDDFLEREVADLEKSAASLLSIIADLEEKLSTEFSEGVVKINKEFQRLFALMFGGGAVSLTVTKKRARRRSEASELIGEGEAKAAKGSSSDTSWKEEFREEKDSEEEGIDIEVNLPRKKIRGLEMLSGGERALTSIALIFAMSQVNPPPFLVLDETDAALDEANSKRYGDMIEELAKHSQLILITHNRETMKRAGVLYGVTMGGDGISKLLSVQFDEVVKV